MKALVGAFNQEKALVGADDMGLQQAHAQHMTQDTGHVSMHSTLSRHQVTHDSAAEKIILRI